MDAAERQQLEIDLRGRVDAGDLPGAATAAIRRYGPELYGFLVGLIGDAEVASDLFASVCERLWTHLPGFRWECSFRVWAYTIARNEFHHWLRDRKRQRRQVALSEVPELAAVVSGVRTSTAPHLRSEVKDAFALLRASLEPDEQVLLGLRVDRKMSWQDIARVLGDDDVAARDAANLRKRFERLTRRLRTQVRAQGRSD